MPNSRERAPGKLVGWALALAFFPLFFAVILLSRSSWGTTDPSLFRTYPLDSAEIKPVIVAKVINVDWIDITGETLSASAGAPGTIWLALVFLSIQVTISAFLLRQISRPNRVKDLIFLTSLGLLSLAVILGRVDDLDDEAYAWASKIENFLEIGILGIPLFDGRFGESSVGTLHFVLSAILKGVFRLSVEQALVWVTIFGVLVATSIAYVALRSRGFPPTLSSLIPLLVFAAPSVALSSSKAFDNSLVLSLLVIWVCGESLLGSERRTSFRVLVATLAPLVRLEFAIYSLVVLAADIIERRQRTQFSLRRVLSISALRWIPAAIVAITWVVYKQLAFGTIVPAMATYKSPWFDLGAFESGSRYLIQSVGETVFWVLGGLVGMLISRFVLVQSMWARFSRWATQNFAVLLPLSVATALGLFSAVASGGDYFGAAYARYFFPYAGAWIFALLLCASWLRKPKGWLNPSLAALAVLTLLVSLNNLSNHRSQVTDILTTTTSRVTCDRAGLVAVESLFKELGAPRPSVIATPEINGAAYYFEAELVDMISLVDTETDKVLAPQKPGSTFDKFQVVLSDAQLQGTDIVWLWPSSRCGLSKNELANHLANGEEEIRDFLTNPDGLYRFPQVGPALRSGLAPIIAGFRYTDAGEESYGLLMFLARNVPL